jgi:hypothetical protein
MPALMLFIGMWEWWIHCASVMFDHFLSFDKTITDISCNTFSMSETKGIYAN